MRYAILGGGFAVSGCWFGVALVGWQNQPVIWLTAIPVWIVVSSLIAVWLHWPQVKHERAIHTREAERLQTEPPAKHLFFRVAHTTTSSSIPAISATSGIEYPVPSS